MLHLRSISTLIVQFEQRLSFHLIFSVENIFERKIFNSRWSCFCSFTETAHDALTSTLRYVAEFLVAYMIDMCEVSTRFSNPQAASSSPSAATFLYIFSDSCIQCSDFWKQKHSLFEKIQHFSMNWLFSQKPFFLLYNSNSLFSFQNIPTFFSQTLGYFVFQRRGKNSWKFSTKISSK